MILALYLVHVALDYVSNRQAIEAAVVAGIVMVLMRASTMLIRVSTAARIAYRDSQSK